MKNCLVKLTDSIIAA